MSIRFVRAVIEAAEYGGVPRARFLQAAQLETNELDDSEARVTRSVFYRLCDLALDLTSDPALGLHGAEVANTSTSNVVGNLIAHAPTLRKALEALLQATELLGSQPRIDWSRAATAS